MAVCRRLGPIAVFTLVAGSSASTQSRPYPTSRHGGNYMHNYYLPPAPSSTPWHPAWSPGGDEIAASMHGSIWVIELASGTAREVTYNEKYHGSPTWSPDGRWIVYTADDGGQTIQLEALDTQTGETVRLTDDDFLYLDPRFSPSGDRLAYVSNRPNGYFNVYVRHIHEGRWAGDEIAITEDHQYSSSRLYFGAWDMHLTPAWLPSGDELLLVSNRNSPLGSGNVLRVPAIPLGITQSVTVLEEQTLYRTRPDVSIDGKRFVYSSTRATADQFNNLYVQPTNGGEPYKLTFFEHDAFHPRWSPDGEWIAYIDNEHGLSELRILETYGGAQRVITISERTHRRPTGTLAVELRDEATGDLTAARVHVTASDGKFYAPDDAYARIGASEEPLFHAPESFTITLPAGPVRLVAVKGFEFFPESTVVEIAEGETANVTLSLRRMTNLSDAGWYSGSTHVHMNYGGNLRNTLENLMMMSDAEDQDVINELIANKDNRVLDHQFFVPGGSAHPISRPDRLLVVGQEYRPPFYGHVFMLGLRDHLISPYTTGYEGTAIESLYPSNTDMLRKAKAQGATVGYVHPFFGSRDPLETNLGGGKGFMVDAALGTTDALEWSAAGRAGLYPLYAVWNNGFAVTATGGEDSISDLHRSKLVGSVRTYVCTGESQPTAESWYANLRAGHAFVTTGPLVDLRVEEKMAGETVVTSRGNEMTFRARVQSITPLRRALLVFNGNEVRELLLSSDRRTVDVSDQWHVPRSGWMHLIAEGDPGERLPLDAGFALAFTNPIWIVADGEEIRDEESARYGTRWIDTLRDLAEVWPGWRSQAERDHVFGQFDEARTVYEELARGGPGSGRMPVKYNAPSCTF